MRSALLVVIVAVSACSGGTTDGHETPLAAQLDLPDLSNGSVDVTTPLAVDQPRDNTPAPSPYEAVDRFVRAEIDADTDASYDLLSASDRNAVRSRTAWRRVQASLPKLITFVPAATQDPPSTAGATIRGEALFVASLDEINGLVAENAAVTWTVVAEEGGWRVAYQRTVIQPAYPNDSGATDTARSWLTAYQNCTKPDAELEYSGGLVGNVGVAATLCKTTTSQVDPPRRLGDRPDPSAVLAAFGPEADTWARTIRVTAGRSFNLVLAPFSDHWIVIGVLGDGP